MKKLVTLLLILTLTACHFFKENGIEVKIQNDSGDTIRNIQFTTTEKLGSIQIDKIDPNESATAFLSMRKNKTDGAYRLSFARESGLGEVLDCGYYTNGRSLSNHVEFIVERDTTFVNFKMAKK